MQENQNGKSVPPIARDIIDTRTRIRTQPSNVANTRTSESPSNFP